MKKPAEAGLLFWVTRHSCPGDYAARAKTSSLAAFAVTSFASSAELPQPYGFHITVLPSLLSHPVEARSGPSETYFVLQYGLFHKESHGLQICFWWTRWESNPRPECLYSKGITTILLFFVLGYRGFIKPLVPHNKAHHT